MCRTYKSEDAPRSTESLNSMKKIHEELPTAQICRLGYSLDTIFKSYVSFKLFVIICWFDQPTTEAENLSGKESWPDLTVFLKLEMEGNAYS